MHIFGHSKFIPVFLGKIAGKNSEQPFLAILNIYQSFGRNCQKKFGMAIFGHSELFFWETLLEKIWNAQFWSF